jgi:hypothetical protein
MLAGALARMQDSKRNARSRVPVTESVRHGGIMVAAHAPTPGSRDEAVRTLRSAGALDVETAQGEWHQGRWADFDPTVPPARVRSRREEEFHE